MTLSGAPVDQKRGEFAGLEGTRSHIVTVEAGDHGTGGWMDADRRHYEGGRDRLAEKVAGAG